MPLTVPIRSEAELLQADLYGSLPARRAAILCHGESWGASGWSAVAPPLVERGLPTLAVNLRGYGGSSGRTYRYVPGQPWSPVSDLRAAAKLLRDRGAAEIVLVGASLGGHAVLATAVEEEVESVITVSAPVAPVPDELSARVRGRKLYVGTSDDDRGATEHMLASFKALTGDKRLLLFGGTEHSRAMFTASYGADAIAAIAEFAAQGL